MAIAGRLAAIRLFSPTSADFLAASAAILVAFKTPKNQIAIHTSDYDQQSVKYNQENIEPGIIWCALFHACYWLALCQPQWRP